MNEQLIITLWFAFLIGGMVGCAAYLNRERKREAAANLDARKLRHYRTKTGIYLHCIDGGKSRAAVEREWARGSYDIGDEKIYRNDAFSDGDGA